MIPQSSPCLPPMLTRKGLLLSHSGATMIALKGPASGRSSCPTLILKVNNLPNYGFPLTRAVERTDLLMPVKFTQSCPTCGRRIDVRASLLGCTVACQHCGAEFAAKAGEEQIVRQDSSENLLKRVEQALRKAEQSSMVGTAPHGD